MADSDEFNFESAPALPGSDRLSKYLFGGIRQLSSRLWDFEVEGRGNVPASGPAIITPNHLSFCDSVFVPAALPRRVWAIGKGEYMDSWKTKHLFPAMGMIPVDRSGGDAAQAALDTAAKVLDAGRLFMIYPEGTRSRSGHLHKGRTGAARLALRCDAPIVPVGHEGTVEVQPPDTFAMKPGKRVVVRFGAPMWIHEHGDPDDPRTLRRFTDAVMFEIAQLSGQRYVDRYASKDDKPDASPVAAVDGSSTTPSSSTEESEHVRVTPRRPSVVGAPSNGSSPSIGKPRGRDGARTGADGPVDTSTPPSMPLSASIKRPPGRTASAPVGRVRGAET
ncbi:MAG: lysophospholipid acyltransferase family protein [Ilumatobacter sp.]